MAEPLADSLDDLASPGQVVAGKYRIERVLGQGGMGVVVEAWHLQFEERVAIKFLRREVGANPEAQARFEREARAAFKIKNEHVARVIDVGKLEQGTPYLVMEFLEGIDLAEVLVRERRLPVATAVAYVLQTCEAVAEAHALGIVHRDLKPENLFLTRRADGSACIKVLDFGLSKVSAKDERRERKLTNSQQVMGTPQYMSPEQWLSSHDVGPAADQWALGVILYELVTGVQPFNHAQLPQLCSQVLSTEPAPMASHLPGAPPELEKVVLRCLRKQPEARHANVGELALQLFAFADGDGRSSARRAVGALRAAGIEVVEEVPPSNDPPTAGGLGSTQVMFDPDSVDEVEATRERLRRAEAALLAAQRAPSIVSPSVPPLGAGPPASVPPLGAGSPLYESGTHAVPQLPTALSVAPLYETGMHPAPRAETSPGWQHALGQPDPRPRRGLWVAVSLAVLVPVLGAAAFVWRARAVHQDGAAPSASATADADGAAPAPSASATPSAATDPVPSAGPAATADETPAPSASATADGDGAAPTPSARAAPSAAPSAKAGASAKPRALNSASAAPMVGSKRPPPRKPSIYHDRL